MLGKLYSGPKLYIRSCPDIYFGCTVVRIKNVKHSNIPSASAKETFAFIALFYAQRSKIYHVNPYNSLEGHLTNQA